MSRPKPGQPVALQIMLHSPTETPGDTVRPPLSGVTWGGWIEISSGRISSIEPLGVDHFSDEFHQVSDRRLWFTCKTRGDFDGVLLRLAQVSGDTTVTVRVSYVDVDAVGTGGQRAAARPPGPPSRVRLHEVGFRLDEVAQKRARLELAPHAIVFARQVNPDAPWDASFQYRPAQPPAAGDYFYLRVVQLDGEAAWTSPVFVGK